MTDKTQFMVLADEVIKGRLEVADEFFRIHILPLIEYQKKRDKDIARKEIAEMYRLEEEA